MQLWVRRRQGTLYPVCIHVFIYGYRCSTFSTTHRPETPISSWLPTSSYGRFICRFTTRLSISADLLTTDLRNSHWEPWMTSGVVAVRDYFTHRLPIMLIMTLLLIQLTVTVLLSQKYQLKLSDAPILPDDSCPDLAADVGNLPLPALCRSAKDWCPPIRFMWRELYVVKTRGRKCGNSNSLRMQLTHVLLNHESSL